MDIMIIHSCRVQDTPISQCESMIQYHQGDSVASVACPCVRKGDNTTGHTSLCMPLVLDVLTGLFHFFHLFFRWAGMNRQKVRGLMRADWDPTCVTMACPVTIGRVGTNRYCSAQRATSHMVRAEDPPRL